MWRQFVAQRLGKRHHIGLGSIIDRHPGPRQKAGDRADIEDAAAAPDQTVGKPQRQVRQGADIDRDDVELLCAIELHRLAEQAEACIVDDELDIDACRLERLLDPVAGIALFEIAGNHDRRSTAGCRDLAGELCQTVRAPRDQRHAMAVRGKYPRKLCADPC